MQEFTCDGIFLKCGISRFTEVKDLNTSSSTGFYTSMQVKNNDWLLQT